MLTKKKERKMREVFANYRHRIVELFDQEMGEMTVWSHVRCRLLKLLSADQGLESEIIGLMLEGQEDEFSIG